MVKAEWGTKRTCPKCGTRFYDLGNETPVECINCGETWEPEPVLKSKQPLPYEDAKKEGDNDLSGDDDLDIDVDAVDANDSPDNDVDLGGDEEIVVSKTSDNDDKEDT